VRRERGVVTNGCSFLFLGIIRDKGKEEAETGLNTNLSRLQDTRAHHNKLFWDAYSGFLMVKFP
jgi:hypothetical protein